MREPKLVERKRLDRAPRDVVRLSVRPGTFRVI